MRGAQLVSNLIEKYQPRNILDLGAGKGYFSILAASYGAYVDAVEDTRLRNMYPDYLKEHPNVTFYDSPLDQFEITKQYDLIIAKHIVMYMRKDFVLGNFLPDIYNHLNREGLVFITYHRNDSYLMKEKPGTINYSLEELKSLKGNYLVKDFGNYSNPAPELNQEYKIGYIVLQKQ